MLQENRNRVDCSVCRVLYPTGLQELLSPLRSAAALGKSKSKPQVPPTSQAPPTSQHPLRPLPLLRSHPPPPSEFLSSFFLLLPCLACTLQCALTLRILVPSTVRAPADFSHTSFAANPVFSRDSACLGRLAVSVNLTHKICLVDSLK